MAPLEISQSLPLSHRPLNDDTNSMLNTIIAIILCLLVVFSIANAVYIAYTRGRAAGQRDWARDVVQVRGGWYRDDSDDEEEIRWRMQQEEYDADGEGGSLVSF